MSGWGRGKEADQFKVGAAAPFIFVRTSVGRSVGRSSSSVCRGHPVAPLVPVRRGAPRSLGRQTRRTRVGQGVTAFPDVGPRPTTSGSRLFVVALGAPPAPCPRLANEHVLGAPRGPPATLVDGLDGVDGVDDRVPPF